MSMSDHRAFSGDLGDQAKFDHEMARLLGARLPHLAGLFIDDELALDP